MSCGDLSGASIRVSEHEAPATVTVPAGAKLVIEGKIEADAPSCNHGMTFQDVTRGLGFGVNDNVPPGTWDQANSPATGLPTVYTASATPGDYILRCQGDHYAGGYPTGPITPAQVESADLTVRVVAAGTLREVDADGLLRTATAGAPVRSADSDAQVRAATAGAAVRTATATAPARTATAGAP